ncbi:MAG: tetratricopeptide repeat protein [Pseudomonadota bacterium]
MLTKKHFISFAVVSVVNLGTAWGESEDYKNFDLPEQSRVALPEKSFSYKSARAEIRGQKSKLKTPSMSAQDFLFAKETFVAEKRDEAIKLLRQELDSGAKVNRDNVLLQLGQLYVEKYMEFSYRESQVYNQQYSDYEQAQAEGKKGGAAPQLDNSRSSAYLKDALRVFYQLEKEYPKHPKIDEVIYFIGFVEMEAKNDKKGVKYLERLVKDFPQSRKYEDATVYLADTYFDQNKFKEAKNYYQILVKRDSNLKDYARYKLAWVDLNTGGARQAVKDMKSLILSLGSSAEKAKFSLREQALRDLVVFYGDTGEVDDAVEFFTKAQGKSKALDNLKLLAQLFSSKAQDEAAVKAYTRLIKEFGDAPEAPKWYLGIYESEARLGKSKGGVNKLVELVEKFNDDSNWAKSFPEDKQSEKKEMLDLIAGEAEKAAFFHHQAGQRSSDKGHYEAAIKLYSSLLKNFPQLPSRKKIAFFRGEALYAQSQWMEASDSYLMASKIPPKDKMSEESVYNALLSVEHLTAKNTKITKYSKEEAKKVDTSPKDLNEPEEKFIEVAQIYSQEYPQAPHVTDAVFRVGAIYYQKNHFEKANEVFLGLVKDKPKHRTAPTAAHLILDMYNIRKDYSGLTKQAQVFYEQASLGDAKFKAEMKQIMGEVDFKQIEAIEKENKWTEAGDAYFRFYQANPKSDLAEKALYNAFVSYEKGESTEKATEMARVFVSKYPKSEYVGQMMLSIAKTAEKAYDFEQAQRFYEDYAERFPADKEARKALYNAAVFSELLEKNKEALKLYDQYLKESGVSQEERRAIRISQSKIYRKEGNWDKVKAIYRELSKEARNSDERVKILAELARLMEKAGKTTDKDAVVKEIRTQVDPRKKASLGLASFYLAEVEFGSVKAEREKYQKIKLRFPPEAFVSLLKKKQKALLKLAGSYDNVVEFGVPDWGVAALYEKGEAYQEMASAFRSVKVPKSYKPEEKAELEGALKAIEEKDIVPIEKAGKEIWEACAKRASEFKVVSSYAEKCREKTGKSAQMKGFFPKARYWSFGPWIKSVKSESEEPNFENSEEALAVLIRLSSSSQKGGQTQGLLKKYLLRYPNEKKAVFLLACEYLKQGKKELAQYFFDQLEKDSSFPWKGLISNNEGMLALQDKSRIQATALFEKASEESPEHPSSLINLGSVYLEGFGFKEALKYFEKAVELNPENEDAILGLGLCYEEVNEPVKAAKAYDAFIAENPNATQVLFNYSILLGNTLKKREQAAQIMLRYIQRGGKEASRAHEIMKTWR